MVTTSAIRDYLLTNSPWVDAERTVDTVKAGDPAKEVKRAGVCWFACIATIRAARNARCDLLICHEPAFWQHEAPETYWRDKEPGAAKQRLLEETGLVVLRAHDTWDQWPGLGIRDSWAASLGLERVVHASVEHNYHAVYETEERSLRQFALEIARRVKPLGEDSIRVMGDPDRRVSRPALGVGCIGPDMDMVKAGADVLIVCYDGASYWAVRERLYELGVAVIVVEHGTSEVPGMRNLCQHLARQFPEADFLFFNEHPMPWTVSGS